MSDNLKILESQIVAEIDPNGAAGSILAFNHQDILKKVLEKAGKWVGFHFTAEKDPATIISGKLSFNGNAFNNIANFIITTSKLTNDLNDIGDVLNLYSAGTIIHFKDYVGRSAFFEFQSYVASDDGFGNDTYDITVKGLASNINYVYQDEESEIATLSFYPSEVKVYSFACSDEASNLEATKVFETPVFDKMMNVQVIDFGVIVAPTGSVMQFDVHKNGVSIYTTKPTITDGEFTTMTSLVPQVLDGTIDFLVGDVFSVIIDSVGSVTPGVNLKSRIKHF